jgi:hypothetical protein
MKEYIMDKLIKMPETEDKIEFDIKSRIKDKLFDDYYILTKYGWKLGEAPEDYFGYLDYPFNVKCLTVGKIAYVIYTLFIYEVGNISDIGGFSAQYKRWQLYKGKEKLIEKVKEYFDNGIFMVDNFYEEFKKNRYSLYEIILKSEFPVVSEETIEEVLKEISKDGFDKIESEYLV